MLNFNGGTSIAGTSLAPLSGYAGYVLMQSGNIVISICFLVVTGLYLLIVLSTLCRYIINYQRNKHMLESTINY